MSGKKTRPQSTRARYSGLEAAERTRRRRAALLEAALDLFAGQGYAATSVKHICRQAGLTERYFYESFRDRHACLVQLYGELADQLYTRTTEAIEQAGDRGAEEVVERALAAFIDHLAADPRRARVVLIEVVGASPELEERRHTVLRTFAELTVTVWMQHTGRAEPTSAQRLAAVGLVGAVNHLLVDWLHRQSPEPQEELVGACTRLYSAVYRDMES